MKIVERLYWIAYTSKQSNISKHSKQNNMKKDKFEKLLREHNKLLSSLRGLQLNDLLALWIEAKTGNLEDIDKIPVGYFLELERIGKHIDILLGDMIIDSIQDKEE